MSYHTRNAAKKTLCLLFLHAAALHGAVPSDAFVYPTASRFIVPAYLLVNLGLILGIIYLLHKNRLLLRKEPPPEPVPVRPTDPDERCQSLINTLFIAAFHKDASLRYTSVSQPFARLTQAAVNEIVGKSDPDLFDMQTATQFENDDFHVIESRAGVEFINCITIKGQTRWVKVRRVPTLDDSGVVTGIRGVMSDITDMKRSEEQLAEIRKFNESILRSTLDIIYIYNLTDESIIYTNPQLCNLLGYDDEELRSMRSAFHLRLIHPDDVSKINDLLMRCMAAGDDATENISFRIHDIGGRWLWLHGRYAVFKRDAAGAAVQIIATLHDITERVMFENDLTTALDRAQRYLDIVETVIVALDRDGCITLINRKGQQLLGQHADDLIGRNWFELCVTGDNKGEAGLFFAAMLSCSIKPLEYYENSIRSADGSIRRFAWHNSLLTEEPGRVTGMLCAGEDITIRKEADELLKTDKLRQNMLLTLSQQQSLTVDRTMDYALDTALILTKSSIGYLYLYSEERRVFDLYSWSKNVMERCRVIKKQSMYELDKTGLWGEAVRQRQPIITNDYNAENRFKRGLPEGHVPLQRHCNIPVFDNGKIVAVIGVANKLSPYTESDVRHLQLLMDGVWKIKKRIEIEAEVRQLNEELEKKVQARTGEVLKAHDELQRFFTLTPDLLCIASTEGYFLRCSNAWEQTLGYPLDTLQKMRFLDLVHPDDIDKTLHEMELLVAGDDVKDFTNRYRCSDGSYRWIEWRSSAVGSFVYAAARDITEKKKNEDMLIRAKDEADRANHAKSYFLANMSHEIRTPLNAVIGYSELLATLSCNEKEQSYIDSITLAGRNLLRLINDILDLSKIEADMMTIHYEPVDISSIAAEIGQIFSFTIGEKRLAFSIAIDDALPRRLLLDEVRVRQIMLNLVGNAVKFTGSGFITLGISCLPCDGTDDRITLLIRVSDSGMGISPDELTSIFDAFHQQKGQSPQYGGTGLGLAICKKLVEIMNGTISVESTLNRGSTFTVTLNGITIAPAIPDSPRSLSQQAPRRVFAANTVLVVDSIPTNLDIFSTMLTGAGLTVLTAGNGKDAVDIARNRQPACIIMDTALPDMGAAVAATHIRSITGLSGIPIISIATDTGSSFTAAGHGNLFAEHLVRPVTMNILMDTLAKYLPLEESAAPPIDTIVRETPHLPEALLMKARDLLGAVKMGDIRAFARQLLDHGESAGNQDIITLGNNLLNYAGHFDIEAVRKLLRRITSPE